MQWGTRIVSIIKCIKIIVKKKPKETALSILQLLCLYEKVQDINKWTINWWASFKHL